MTQLEKMAVALYMADYPGTPGHPDDSDTDAMMFGKYRDHYLDCARAALLAIREPDGAEVEHVSASFMLSSSTFGAAFSAMIDAILNEKPEAGA